MRRTCVGAIMLGSAAVWSNLSAYGQSVDYRQSYVFQAAATGFDPGFLSNLGTTVYGATQYGGKGDYGTVFSFNLLTGVETLIYAFHGNDGEYPSSSLVEVGDLLYGTTLFGGDAGCGYVSCGALYSLNPATGVQTVVHNFQGGADGYGPEGNLVAVGHLLYGTTLYGGVVTGNPGQGTVFSLDVATGSIKTLYQFSGSDGSAPNSLLNVNGTIYGTSSGGGAYGQGTVYSLDPATGVENVVYSFKGGSDGEYPNTLIEVGGLLYGTTYYGGSVNCTYSECAFGTVFSIDPATGAESVVYAFQGGNDGASPYGSLLAIGDTLYGTTILGGSTLNCVVSLGTGCGTVFSLSLATRKEQVLHAFQSGADGNEADSLIRIGSTLYGTTAEGGGSASCDVYGNAGCGTMFQISR